ncbi:hypothetical protein X801_02427, partial [Opisthorchis viverrini]
MTVLNPTINAGHSESSVLTYFHIPFTIIALLPSIRSFLCDDLGSLPLPPTVDHKRRILLERIDVVTLGPTPAPPENPPPIPSIQRRPLSSVVRLFSSSRKRYSLPASIRYPPQLPEVVEPPLPPKGHQHALSLQTSKTTEDYEVPRSVVDCVSGTGSPSHLSSQPLLRQHLRSRHSMSPQLEIVQANQSTAFVSPQTPQLHPPIVTPDSRDDIALTLPKKCLTTQTRRFSAFMDSPWTLIGSLHHRYKPNKWTRLNMCLLASGSRLIAYKSGNAMNPSLVIFLCGATGVYAGRDSGMDFVIKIAHPTRGTTVLAADTEAQALMWIKQINMYAQGITPSEIHSFLEHPGITNSISSVPLLPPSCIPAATPIRSPSQPDGDHLNGCLPNGLEIQEDSGFSAPVSSGSEGNSADGVVSGHAFQCHPSVFKSQSSSNVCLSSAVTCIPGTVVTDSPSVGPHELCNACKAIQTPVESTYPLVSTTLVQADTVSCRSVTSAVTLRPRRESLLSSMKRKVESLNSKRRARKSLPQAFGTMESRPCASNTMGLAESNQPVTNVESTSLLADDNKSFTTAVQMPPPAAAARLPGSLGTCASGFDWPQLESACGLFLKSSPLFPSPSPGRMRPRSFVGPSGGSWDKMDQSTVPFNATHIHGPLVDLTHVGFCPHHRGISRSDCESHVIVSGEAYVSIPGRVPWTNRWCCLRSHCLDIYPLTKQPSRARLFNSPTTDDQSITQANAWPFFSLTLEPGQVELGLAGDKYHKAALRLAVPKQSALAILFDAPDKLQMGTWIRGFIEALGIIPLDPSKLSSSFDRPGQKDPVHCSSSDSPQATYDSPGYTYSEPCESVPLVLGNHLIRRNNTGRGGLSMDQSVSQVDINSMTIYDEVCPAQDTSSMLDSKALGYKCRRNSSSYSANPLGTPCFYPRNLRALQQSCHDLISSADMSVESYSGDQTDRWCVPPPSRRLLAQPLPPLPSVGPSGAESVTGTITSSHASSSLTPDDCAFSPVVNSEPELLHSSTGSAKTRSRNHRPPRDPQNLSCPTRRRHSSLGSMDHYEPTCCQSVGLYPDELAPFSPDGRPILDDGDVFLQDMESSTSRTGCTLLSGQLRSQGTSTTHVDFPSNISLLYQDDPTGLAWTDSASPVWSEDSRFNNKSVNAAAARRSVSCVTGTKPTINDPRTVATLPPRSELPPFVYPPDTSRPNPFDDLRPNLLVSLTNDHSLSSTSSQTATSSGVALTAGSFSSGSGGTTRPSSMAITWPPPPTLTEEPDFPGSDSDDHHNHEKPQSRTTPTSPRDSDGQDTRTNVVGTVAKTENGTAASRRNQFQSKSTKPTVKRMHTFSGVDRSTQCPLSSATLSDLPTNASLLLVTTQLEEVQQGAKKLRSRHAALSFRLANRLVREQVHTAKELNENGTESENRSHSTTPPSEDSTENRSKLPAASPYDNSADEGDEATSSLCARLAAIEMLIQQAESIETRLRDEVNQYMTTDISNTPSEQCQTTLNVHTQGRRGRCHRARPAYGIQSCPNTNPGVPPAAQHTARGRGRGGRNRRRRYYGGVGGGGAVRNRPKAWNKSDNNGGHTVAVSPAS